MRRLESFLAYALPLGFVFALGVLHLPRPFHGDQADFLQGARCLAEGGVLYVDYWDVKQPGVFWFYDWAGRLFGFSEVGVHAFELLYWMVFSILSVLLLRPVFQQKWAASLVPVATIGMYYAYAESWDATQVEVLVAFPLFLAAWFASREHGSRRVVARASFLSGLFGGFALVFKLAMAPIILGFLLFAALYACFILRERPPRVLVSRVLPAVMGLLAVIGGVTLYFWWHGALDEFVWTSVVYPLLALSTVDPASVRTLGKGVQWFLAGQMGWLLLGWLGLVNGSKGRQRFLVGLMGVWVLMAVICILVQRFSWWQYHFLLFFVPVGVLGAVGVEAVWLSRPSLGARRRTLLVVGLVAVAMLPALGPLGWRVISFAKAWGRHVPGLESVGPVRRFQIHVDQTYQRIWRETEFLRAADAAPGPIYVFGDPIYLHLAERRAAIAPHGWAWEHFVDRQWQTLLPSFRASRPVYVFIANSYQDLLSERAPDTMAFLEERYRTLDNGHATGQWYELVD